MAPKPRGLGRGLDSLFADSGAEISTAPQIVPLGDIEPDKMQPRKNFEQTALAELAASIAEHGLLQPIVVRPSGINGYVIVAGERRWRACRLAGLKEIPVVIKDITAEQAAEMALVENLQREDLNPVEEAFGYRRLIDSFNLTQEQAAEKVGKSRAAVANSLRLLQAQPAVVDMLRDGALTAGHTKAVLMIDDGTKQLEAAQRIIKQHLSVRAAELLCKKMLKDKPKKRAANSSKPALPVEVELALKEALGTEVKVNYTGGRGTLVVSFYSDEQLKNFANALTKNK